MPAQLGGKHHLIVDNKPGAGGQIAVQALLSAPADGSTFLIAPLITPVLSQIVYKKPGYDPAKDFTPVGLVAHFQFALAVPVTFAESGYPKAVGSGWYSLWARSGTPVATVAAFNRALNKALADPVVKARLDELALDPDPRSPQALEQLRLAEIAKWRSVIEASGFWAD